MNKNPISPPSLPGSGEIWVDMQTQEEDSQDPDDGAIQVIDASTWQVQAYIPNAGNNPRSSWAGKLSDGRNVVATSNWHDNFLTLIDADWKQVIAKVPIADAKYDRLREDPPPTMYEPLTQNRFASGGTFLVRAAGDPATLGNAMRQAIASIDSNIPVFEMRTQLELRDRAISQERLFAALLTGFSALALLLAGIGIYGTLAYAVARRCGEIGIRMALGAGRPSVQRLVVRESLVAVLAGLAIGLGAAATLSRVIESMLYGVQPTDPLAFAGAGAVLVGGATVAAWLPAWRASRVDPMLALRV